MLGKRIFGSSGKVGDEHTEANWMTSLYAEMVERPSDVQSRD